MTTQEAINELLQNIETYTEVKSVEITQFGEILLHFNDNRERKCFHSGLSMLEWLEKEYLIGNATT